MQSRPEHRARKNPLQPECHPPRPAGRISFSPTEDMAAYKAFSKELVDSLDAQTPMERQLAQTSPTSMALRIAPAAFEDGMLALGFSKAECFHQRAQK